MKTIKKIEEIKVNETNMSELIKKKQKISVSYTIKAFSNNIKKMKEAKLINDLEHQQLLELHSTIVQRWIGIEFNI